MINIIIEFGAPEAIKMLHVTISVRLQRIHTIQPSLNLNIKSKHPAILKQFESESINDNLWFGIKDKSKDKTTVDTTIDKTTIKDVFFVN